jgi:hypothetical protein
LFLEGFLVTAPFYNVIKGTSSGTPGTGAFTPLAASSGCAAWSTVPTGWIGLVRFEDGTAWENTYTYWNGTTLSRASTQVIASSTGSALTLTSAATAALVVDAREVQPHIAGTAARGMLGYCGATTPFAYATPATSVNGTGASASIASTNYLTSQARSQTNSATTANAQAGYTVTSAIGIVTTTAGKGGYEFQARFGAATLPTGPRLFCGMTDTTFSGNTGEPSAFVANYATFSKDSTDTNIQLLVNSGVSTGTKTDTGIALVANGWYEATIWVEPGATKVNSLLIRLDTGAIWAGTTTTDVPGNNSFPFPQILGGLSSTTGTAFGLCCGSMMVRIGS